MKQHQLPPATLSLDLDDLWTYLKTHGDSDWSSYPTYLDDAVPRILNFLDQHKQKITFFLVGKDAARDCNRGILSEIAARNHEIANHSFHHDPWLHLYTADKLDQELALAEEHIQLATGIKTTGFRGPGFSYSENLLKVLIKREYQYDASTFPNILNPIARLYFLRSSNLSKEERKKRAGLFGSWKDGLMPNFPYHWTWNDSSILEIPVTTMPLFKVPIHASYILYLSTISKKIAFNYLKLALKLCRYNKVAPSVLLHPLDFLGCHDTSRLSFFPAMKLAAAEKIEIMSELMQQMSAQFNIMTMESYATSLDHSLHPLQKRAIN